MPRHTGLNAALLILATLWLSACSRHGIYETAIGLERSSAGLQVNTVQVDDLQIAYLANKEQADGDTIVMVHGFGATKDNWTRLARELTDDFNVYAIDLPGHGDSSKPMDLGYSLAQQTDHLARILDALALTEYHMMGNSMGGAITALYAAKYPNRVKSVVLFNPAGIMDYESELVGLVMAGDNPLIPSKPGDLERLIDFALEEKPFMPWPVLGVLEEKKIANREINEVIFEAIRDIGFLTEFRNRVQNIEAPTLVVWGKEDRIINYRNGEVFASLIANARLEVMDEIGHAPMIEAPDRSADLFRQLAHPPE
ncbi:alpha/beta fold hydrolase [Marinobacter salinisoli]|uniref:Alpha/beta fold hydrolase n=1 Tax=Marinobacter salinisoli TaxID=2769486 RepID=A0ABX7MVN7_9GAMM|nr:alpha/beta fold hydrolase [Marinobacter salinisoli]QSP95171.1 alpha/beta fold hydrolase [Marinobacter salinisoli]